MKQTVAGLGVQLIIYWVYTQYLKLKIWHFIKGLGLYLFRVGGSIKKTPCTKTVLTAKLARDFK